MNAVARQVGIVVRDVVLREQLNVELEERKRYEAALQDSQFRLTSHLLQMPLAAIEFDLNFEILSWNPAAERIFGYSRAEAIGASGRLIIDTKTMPETESLWAELIISNKSIQHINQNITKTGKEIMCSWYNTPLVNEFGEVVGIMSMCEDITEQMVLQRKLKALNGKFSAHIQNMPMGYMEMDSKAVILDWNPFCEKIFGFSYDEAVGQDVFDLIVPDNAKPIVHGITDALRGNQGGGLRSINENIKKNGDLIICDWYNTPLLDADGYVMGWASLVKDITEQQQETARILRLSRHDTLTDLFNRRYMMERLDEEALRYRRHGKEFSLIICDIDDFKKFNDLHGHQCGDYVLKRVANALKDALRDTDSVARWGGEEFLMLLPETEQLGAGVVAEKLRREVEGMDVIYDLKRLSVTITLGVSSCGDCSVDACINHADQALRKGKEQGKNKTVLFEYNLHEEREC